MSEVKRYKLLQSVCYDDGAFVIPAGQVMVTASAHDDVVQTLRAENARLRKAMQSAYDYITNHRHGKAKAMLFDGLELYRQAALQPKEATWQAK